MGETDGETPEGEAQPMEAEDSSTAGPGMDTLKVPAGKRRKIKSPTPGERRSATPVRGRSQTPFTLYLNRRSATPSGTVWRSITPFLKREEKEKTPFELGKDIKAQLICNKMVFDKALVMDISEAEVEPVRYLTSDVSVIDRAAVMDISNVEVIYVVEEYDEEEFEEEEPIEEVVVVKKKPKKGGRKAKSSSVESDTPTGDQDEEISIAAPVKEKKTKKKSEKKEKSPSPKLSLKLELGGGAKQNKKMFDQAPAPADLPPKRAGKSKLALQMEEQAKEAAKAAEEAAAREANKVKKETFEERQKRLKEEAEEQARLEEEQRLLEEEEAAAADGEEGGEEGGEEDENISQDPYEDDEDEDFDAENHDDEENPEEQAEETRRSSASSIDDFTRPDPDEEERWKRIAEEEGEEFVEKLRKFSRVQRQWRSEKERDAEWQRRREQMRNPSFINFLTDRAAEEGQTVKLACAVAGPELSTKWFKDGKQLEPGPKYRIINNNNILTLQVNDCNMMDSGEYSCYVNNSNDNVTSSCIVTIYQVFKDEPSPPTFSLIRDFYHLHDDELTIECHVHGIPRPKISWIKDNLEIKPSFKFTILEEAHGVYKLLIYRPSSRDSGKYICKAINSSGEQEISHVIEFTKPKHFHAHGLHHANNLIAKSIEAEAKKAMEEALKSKAESDSRRQPSRTDEPFVPPKQKLSFATHLRDRMALEKVTVKLMCNIIGPNPAIKWVKDDNPLQWGPKIKNLSTENHAVLELNDVGPSSSGVYKLTAKNDHSEINTSCYLKIYSAQTEGDESEPMFALPIKDVYHSSENDLIISTKVRGNPRPTITWLKDELPIVADSRIQQIEHLDGICELIINKPSQKEDSGIYTCVANNTLGSVKTIHTVVIDNLPSSRRSSTTMSLGSGSEADGRRTSTTSTGTKLPKKEKREKKEEPVEESGGRRRVAMPDPTLKEKLYFIVNLTNRHLPVGSRCKMQAVVSGPDPQIKWLKNEEPVVYGPKIRNMSNSGMAILEFLNATVEDSGEYTLICRNQANQITATAILNIYETKVSSDAEPVFTRALKDTYHLNSDELILESHVRGQPEPIVQWFKDSVEIKSNEKYEINKLPDGTCELVIDKPNQYDTGKYVCKAENSAGKSEISHVVLHKNQPTHIAENIHGVFHADKTLFRKNKETENPEPEKSSDDTDSVSSKGRGRSKGKPPSTSKETTPAAPEPKEPEKPIKEEKREKRIGIYFAANLSDRVIAEGSKVKLSCYVQSPDPQVKWFKDDQPVVYGPKSKQMLMQGLCTLELPNVTEEESGIYKCFAKDNTGEVTTTCKITVYPSPGSGDVPPTFTRSIKDTYRHKMNELLLDVHVRGLPTPSVTWVKDGVKLEPSEKYHMTQDDEGTCELYISDPLPRDGGKYVCKAENRAAETEIVHIVHIDAKNLRPISPVRDHREPESEKEASKEPSTRESSKTREESKGGDSRPPSREGSKVDEEDKKEKPKKKVQEVEYAGRREPPPPPDTKRMLHFGNLLSNRTVAEGSTVRMSVYISGPDPQCRWFKGEQPIVFTPKTKMSCQDNLALLILTQLTEEDCDEYKLVARGTENIIETSCKVIVYKLANEQSTAPVFTVGIKECKLTGNPTPNISWQRDNTDIILSSRLKFENLPDGVMQLTINNPNKDDTGIYTCVAENSAGRAKVSKFLDISDHIRILSERKERKKIEQFKAENSNEYLKMDTKNNKLNVKLHLHNSLKNFSTQMKNTVTLCCEISGYPEEIIWFKDKQEIDANLSNYRLLNHDGLISLEIINTMLEDSGQYECIIKNNKNEISSKSEVQIFEKFDSSTLPDSFSSQIKESYDAYKNEITLECVVHGRPKISWYKDNNLLLPTSRYRQIDEIGGIYKLIIRNPGPNDFRKYTCRAETDNEINEITTILNRNILEFDNIEEISNNQQYTNGFERADSGYSTINRDKCSSSTSREEKHSRSVGRDISYLRDSRKKPIFTTRLCDRKAIENSTIRLTCNIMGANNTDITWLKNNQPLQNSTRYRLLFDNGLATLELFSVIHDDTGSYSCVAQNDYGESFSYCHLKVYKGYESAQQPIIFTRFIRDNYSLHENELTLDCRVRGNPRPKIKWTKDSEPIVNNDKYSQYDQADGYCKLVISKPTVRDSGVYVCEAENSVQAEKISHEVVFAGQERFIQEKTMGFFHRDPNKPHFLSSLGNHIVTVGGTVAIQAEFVITNSDINVQWLKDKLPLSSAPTVKKFFENGVHTLAISNVSPDNDGLYTCRAINAFGKAESSANVHISTDIGKSKMVLFLSRPESEMKIAVGDPFSISFRVQGDPKPKLTLMKGSKDITRSDRVSKEASDDYTRFTIHNSTVADSGTYFVLARNEDSTDRIFVTVTVRQRAHSLTPTLPRWGQSIDSCSDFSYFKNPPGPISTEPMIVDSGKHHLSLTWGKPASGDSAPVVAYRVDAWMIGSDGGAVWKELGLTGLNSFDAFNLKQGGSYHFRVTPKNRYGWGESVKTTYPITIGGAECLPEFVKILPGQMKALVEKECILECTVRGTPRPRIVWYKDGQPIPSTDRVMIKQIGYTCKLRISQIFDIDSGRYTCEAANNIGRVSTFARLQVVSDPKLCEADNKLKMYVSNDTNGRANGEMIPMFTMRLRDRRVQVTYPVRMTCQIVGFPPAQVTWYKNGNEIENDGRFLCCDDGQFNTLEISKTCLDDSGTFTATAKNEMGSISCHCSLIVDKGIRAYIAPDFYQPLDPVYLFKEGQEIRLSAKVEAYPSVGVAWHRNGTRLRPSRRILATLNHDGFVELIIADATMRDAGIYVCVASNPVGRIESSCRIVIEEGKCESLNKSIPIIRTPNMPYSKEPMFVTKPRSSDAYEGDTVIICCEVVGDPKPEVVWLRDFLKPEYYKDAPHFRPIGDGPEYRLEIPSAKLDFTGTYSVIATNCHGETQAIISLQIKAKDISNQNAMEKGSIRHGNVETFPSVIRHLKDLRCCDGDSITLECHVEGVPEPIVMWEKDGHILPSDKEFQMSYNGTRATLAIPRVYPEDEGEYTCIATNNIGRSFSSACVLVDVPEEKENLLSRQLARPAGLILSANSTPRSTPRGTPIRNVSPLRLSYRNTSIDLSTQRRQFAAPKFYAIPHNRVVEEGESVRFQCAIAGHPLPWSTWDKDGMIVAQTARISVKERDDLRVLEIDEVTFEDAGLYRITLENDFGRIEATARLDVIASSRRNRSRSMRGISNSPRRNLYLSRRIMGPSTRIGGRMALSCSFRGSSVPARRFYHNGDEIIESERCHIYLTDSDACLVIDDVTKMDEGVYTCIAQNEFGLLTTTTSVIFYDTVADIPIELPKIIRQLPKELRIKEGETVDLNFEIEDTCEPYLYVWTRNGEVLIDCDEFRYIDHGNGILALRIFDTFDLDAGFYTCTIKTRNVSCTTTCDLIVNEERFNNLDESNLTILKNPLPSIGLQSSIVSFCAKVYPLDAITKWTVCGREIISESREFSLESQPDGVRILHILGIEYNHSGEIKFQVEHPINQNKLYSYTDLIVIPNQPKTLFDFDTETSSNYNPDVPVLITKGPKDCTALIGGTISLDVQFGGRPIPKVNWFKAGRPITESSNIIINTTETNSILQLTSITADDSGKYTVEIMNEHSSDFAVASVAVESVPEPPSGKPSVSQGPDRVSIAWCGPPYDGGCMITGFIIEMQENASAWIEIATVVDSLAYTVKNVSTDNKYKFRVRAENIHGRSEPSYSSDEVTINKTKLQEDINNEDDLHYTRTPISIRQGGEFKARFETLEELGKGRFGIVYKVMEKETQQIMAAKIIKCIKSRDRIKVQEEISIMKALQHPKLLHLAASFETVREIYMVMEYITGGELFERVVADDFTLTERDCLLFLRQICEGVDYMHNQSIVHLDLKPENIMCHTRTSHQIKIIDFGLAQRLNTDSPIRVLFGTPEFIAPEIINYEPISFQTDMWSIGVICYVLLSGLSPFMGDSDVDTFSNITRADYDYDDDAFDVVSQEAKDFISNLLVHRKEDRLTAKECLESKWLTQYQDENLNKNKICTDKLKKFIISRKWQKTGNAIRALGRMANLSASRRNSAVSGAGSNPNSPRPSISIGYGSLLNQNQNIHHMSSVNEEDGDVNSLILVEKRLLHTVKPTTIPTTSSKMRDKSQCSERSDSGFSECSNCSGNNNNNSGNSLCLCPHPLLGKTEVITEETNSNIEKSNELSVAIPHEILKSKLEEIAKKHHNFDDTKLHIDELDNLKIQDDYVNKNENTKITKTINSSSLENFSIEIPMEHRIISKKPIDIISSHDNLMTITVPSSDIHAPKKTIMKSDFTNTITMRKKSLENNFCKEKPKLKSSKIILETPGKVTMLKSRFNQFPSSSSGFVGSPPIRSLSFVSNSSVAVGKKSSDFKNNRSNTEHKNVFDRLAYNSKNNATKTNNNNQSASVPNSPLPQLRSTTSIRLSNRVREATERLSTPKSFTTSTKPIILSGNRSIKQNSLETQRNNIKSTNKNNNISLNNNIECDTKNLGREQKKLDNSLGRS